MNTHRAVQNLVKNEKRKKKKKEFVRNSCDVCKDRRKRRDALNTKQRFETQIWLVTSQ